MEEEGSPSSEDPDDRLLMPGSAGNVARCSLRNRSSERLWATWPAGKTINRLFCFEDLALRAKVKRVKRYASRYVGRSVA